MKSLLIVIDLQKGWRHKTATETVFLNTVALCRRFKGDIIHCCFKNDKDSLFYKQIHWNRFFDPDDIDQIPEIVPFKLPIYWRSTYSCLNDETLPIIKKYEHVYVSGVFTDISVFVTALDIFDLGVPVSVVKDCVGSYHGEEAHDAALYSLDFAIGHRNIINSDKVLAVYDT